MGNLKICLVMLKSSNNYNIACYISTSIPAFPYTNTLCNFFVSYYCINSKMIALKFYIYTCLYFTWMNDFFPTRKTVYLIPMVKS